MIEYQAIVRRRRLNEGGLLHQVIKFIDDIVLVASVGCDSIFSSYNQANPMDKEVLKLIKQNRGRLLAYHYLPKELIFTTVFESQSDISNVREELSKRKYQPQDNRLKNLEAAA